MSKRYLMSVIMSCLVAAALIGTAWQYKHPAATKATETFNAQQLAVYNGKNNAPCYVAVDGTVYSIKEGNLWKEGQHTTSNGLAYCGADLSEAIKQSPHGKSKLVALPIVGTYKK